MTLRRPLAAALVLAMTAGLALADHGRRRGRRRYRKTDSLNITLRLNDNTFCPAGRMWGREGRVEGRDDRVRVWINARTTGRRTLFFRDEERTRGRVSVYEYDKDRRRVGKRVARHYFNLRGRFDSRGRRILCAVFRPPTETGNYLVVATLGGTTNDRTTFGVWYDRDACPRRGHGGGGPHPPRPPGPPPPPPQPPGGGYATCLSATLNVDWNCGSGDDSARLTVRNICDTNAVPVLGASSRGLGGLGTFQQISGSSYLRPGQSTVFEARGRLIDGSRLAEGWVSNLPAAKDASRIDVSCGPNWDDLY